MEDISHELVMFKQGAKDIGLQLNPSNCEIISVAPDSQNSILSPLPGSRVVNLSMTTLLGSQLGDVPGIPSVLTEKTNLLKIMGERLTLLSRHDAYLLLHHSIALPKLLYCLRTAPCFLSPQLQQYDAVLKTIMCNTFNIHLSNDHSACNQAFLPVRHGGLGISSAVQLAPSAFLASVAASSTLLPPPPPPPPPASSVISSFQDALALWTNSCNQSPPEGITSYHQNSWDIPTILAIKEDLLNSATNQTSKSRLLAAFGHLA